MLLTSEVRKKASILLISLIAYNHSLIFTYGKHLLYHLHTMIIYKPRKSQNSDFRLPFNKMSTNTIDVTSS